MDASGDHRKEYRRMLQVLTVIEDYLIDGDTPDFAGLSTYLQKQKDYYMLKQTL